MNMLLDVVPHSIAICILLYSDARIFERTTWDPCGLVRHLQKEQRWRTQQIPTEVLRLARRGVIWRWKGPVVEVYQEGWSVTYPIPTQLRGRKILSWQIVGAHAIFLTPFELIVCSLRSFRSNGECHLVYSLAVPHPAVRYILACSLQHVYCVTDTDIWVVRPILHRDVLEMVVLPV
jgi:hypothetical protein